MVDGVEKELAKAFCLVTYASRSFGDFSSWELIDCIEANLTIFSFSAIALAFLEHKDHFRHFSRGQV